MEISQILIEVINSATEAEAEVITEEEVVEEAVGGALTDSNNQILIPGQTREAFNAISAKNMGT